LAVIFPDRQFVRFVGRDLAHARAHGEAHLDDVVERGFARGGAKRAIVFVGAHGLERGVGVEHPAAAGAKHVPRHVEQPDLRAMRERRDGPLRVETSRRAKSSTLMRLSRRSGASRTSRSSAVAQSVSADLHRRANRGWASLMVERFAHGRTLRSIMGSKTWRFKRW